MNSLELKITIKNDTIKLEKDKKLKNMSSPELAMYYLIKNYLNKLSSDFDFVDDELKSLKEEEFLHIMLND